MTAVAIPATPVRAGSRWLLGGLVVLVAFVVARWAAAPYVVGVFHDDGIYALLARSIAGGQGFHHSHLVGNPAATHYPPLYPLVLATLWRIAPEFPANVPLLLGLNAALLAIAALGWWHVATTRLGWSIGTAMLGALLATLASPVLTLSGALLSEPLFLALLWPALMLSERVAVEGRPGAAIAAGLATGVLMLARTHAFVLLLALVLVLAARRRWRDAMMSAGACVAVQLPWLLWSRSATPRVVSPLEGAYGSYLGWFFTGVREGGLAFVVSTVRVNMGECWMLLQDRFAAGFPPALSALVMALVVAAMIAGGWSFARRTPVTLWFLALYLGIVLVWPYAPWRFAWAVWPLLAMLAMEGGRALWTPQRALRSLVAAGVLLVSGAYLRTELHAYATRSWRAASRQAAAQIAPVLDWTLRHTTRDDVLLGDGEQVIALYTGRRAAPPIDFTAREYLHPPHGIGGVAKLSAMLGAVPATYVIIMAPSLVIAGEALATTKPGLHRIDTLAGGAVYEVVR